MRIAVLGLGYVGSVTAACLASLGHKVIGVDISEEKTVAIRRGEAPVAEPGLSRMIADATRDDLLDATTDTSAAVRTTDAVFVCVNTPMAENGDFDDTQVRRAVGNIAAGVRAADKRGYLVVVRSTCLPDVHERLSMQLQNQVGSSATYVAHPEFLREGSAISDFMSPPVIVFGCDSPITNGLHLQFYTGIKSRFLMLSVAEAALMKYASNVFHAAKITFANEFALFSQSFGVDGRRVIDAFRQDTVLNISDKYLQPGMPFGGSCLPKDLAAVTHRVDTPEPVLPMIQALLESNRCQIDALERRLSEAHHRKIAFLGLAFKRDTDDVRESPVVTLAGRISRLGTELTAWDPLIRGPSLAGANRSFLLRHLPGADEILCESADEAMRDADAVVIGQSIPESTARRLSYTNQQTVYDLAGILDPAEIPGACYGLYW